MFPNKNKFVTAKAAVPTAALPCAVPSIQGKILEIWFKRSFKQARSTLPVGNFNLKYVLNPYYIVPTLILLSLKHPAKYVGRKPRKYTVPVPVVGSGEAAASLTGKP